jgi:hypothetical protein
VEQPRQRGEVIKLIDLLERAMGIEPTSEAWEACFISQETHKLAAILRF